MRLINAKTHKLEHFIGTTKPKYAILSHTWMPHGEVLYEDMEDLDQATLKPGFKKIELTCKQALLDSLDYVWVDTCCIDKRSSAEVSEAINSMFNWYKNSAICYAYLVDVEHSGTVPGSRWFRRGWTLQELIAPTKLIFYSKHWCPLGSRSDYAQILSPITRIGVEILNRDAVGQDDSGRDVDPYDGSSYGGRPYHIDRDDVNIEAVLSTISIANKMSWAARRMTTRPEDKVYSLLGIFQINMPLLYGEGDRAFRRLQEEVMKNSVDHSLFIWGNDVSEYYGDINSSKTFSVVEGTSVLAVDPSQFGNSSNITRDELTLVSSPYQLTKKGLQIELPIYQDGNYYWAAFACRSIDSMHKVVAVPLYYYSHKDLYARARLVVRFLHRDDLNNFEIQTICLSAGLELEPFLSQKRLIAGIVFRSLPKTLRISSYEPDHHVDKGSRMLCRDPRRRHRSNSRSVEIRSNHGQRDSPELTLWDPNKFYHAPHTHDDFFFKVQRQIFVRRSDLAQVFRVHFSKGHDPIVSMKIALSYSGDKMVLLVHKPLESKTHAAVTTKALLYVGYGFDSSCETTFDYLKIVVGRSVNVKTGNKYVPVVPIDISYVDSTEEETRSLWLDSDSMSPSPSTPGE